MVILLTLISGVSQAETFLVTTDSEFIEAVDACAEGDTILMAPGEYLADVTITRGITLRGQTGTPEDVIISRVAAITSLIDISGGIGVHLEGLWIREHFEMAPLVDVFSTSLIVRDCRFGSNGAIESGGAIGARSSILVLENSTFEDNSSFSVGGGAIQLVDCRLKMSNCKLTNNHADRCGGALYMDGGTLDMNDCYFSDNNAGDNGGGLELRTVKSVIVGCRFEENSSYNTAGALHVWAGSFLEMSNTEIVGNYTQLRSGGMVVKGATTVILSDCTFEDNEGPFSDDGNIGSYCSALFKCCYLDLDQWIFSGTVEFDDSGCQVSTRQQTLGGLKAMYR